ncbi:MAG: transcription elongation factor GreA [Calditrichae bacterium]|nr:transcription elongation factor GreA [Calditrichia bacterium]
MPDYIYLSQEGYDRLKLELEELKGVKRPEISRKISEARDFGDLKENAEYHAAKEAQAVLEVKIMQLEQTMSRAKVLKKNDIASDKVTILSQVRLKDINRDLEVEYTLVSPQESDFKQNKISTTSPVGKALLGKEKGDVVEIKVPAGILKYEVMDLKLSI